MSLCFREIAKLYHKKQTSIYRLCVCGLFFIAVYFFQQETLGLMHLRLSGLLKEISGLIGGHFKDCGDQKAVDQLLSEVVSDLSIPVISGVPIGHGNVNATLPVGCAAELDTKRMGLKLIGPWLRD